MSTHAAAAALDKRDIATPTGPKWSAILAVLRARKRLATYVASTGKSRQAPRLASGIGTKASLWRQRAAGWCAERLASRPDPRRTRPLGQEIELDCLTTKSVIFQNRGNRSQADRGLDLGDNSMQYYSSKPRKKGPNRG